MNSLLRPLWATSLVCAAALPAQNPVDWWPVSSRRIGDLSLDGTFAYDAVRGITMDGAVWRSDIGHRAVKPR